MKPSFDVSLYLVTDPRLGGSRSPVSIVEEAVAGGVTLVQLRDPQASTRDLIVTASALKALLDRNGIPLIVNDRVDVAAAVGAAGVHLGGSDMPADAARAILGDDALIGLSIGTPAELHTEEKRLAFVDYIGTGPVFSTSTKSDAGSAIGTSGLSEVAAQLALPCVAIGGITTETAGECIHAGADGVAVVSAIVGAEDPRGAAQSLKNAILEARSQ